MGHDIEPFCKHDLPFGDINKLGLMLSEKFKYKITCINKSWSNVSWDSIEDILSVSNAGTTYPTYRLVRERDDASSDFLGYEFESEYEKGREYQWNIIYRDKIYIKHYYCCRWFQLCYYFMNTHSWAAVDIDNLTLFRYQLRYFSDKVGGNKVILLDDQSTEMNGLGQGTEEDMSWDSLQQEVCRLAGDQLLDISKYFLNEKYKEKWLNSDKFPLAFIDDFRDMAHIPIKPQ